MDVCNSIDVAGASGGQCLHGLGAAAKLRLTLSNARRPCPKYGLCTGERSAVSAVSVYATYAQRWLAPAEFCFNFR